MKLGHIFLIILTTIITFIGLICNKIYEKFIKNNWILNIILYIFWTLLVLRVLVWVAKPLVGAIFEDIIMTISNYLSKIPEVHIECSPILGVGIVFIVVMSLMIYNTKRICDKL